MRSQRRVGLAGMILMPSCISAVDASCSATDNFSGDCPTANPFTVVVAVVISLVAATVVLVIIISVVRGKRRTGHRNANMNMVYIRNGQSQVQPQDATPFAPPSGPPGPGHHHHHVPHVHVAPDPAAFALQYQPPSYTAMARYVDVF